MGSVSRDRAGHLLDRERKLDMWKYSDAARRYMLSDDHLGLIDDADAVGMAAEPDNSTLYKCYLKLGPDGRIADIRFDYRGSPVSVATAGVLSKLVVNRTPDFATMISEVHLERELEMLPEDALDRPIYSLEALKAVLRELTGGEDVEETDPLVCHCMTVPRSVILRAIRDERLTSVMEVRGATKAGTGCGSCMPDVADLLTEEQRNREEGERQKRVTALIDKADAQAEKERLRLIAETIDDEIRPAIALDGGDIELVGVEGNHVAVRFSGACRSCESSATTLEHFVVEKLRELVSPAIVVSDVSDG